MGHNISNVNQLILPKIPIHNTIGYSQYLITFKCYMQLFIVPRVHIIKALYKKEKEKNNVQFSYETIPHTHM